MGQYRTVGAAMCGCVFAAAWWLWIDSVVFTTREGHDPNDQKIIFPYFLPGIFATLSFIM